LKYKGAAKYVSVHAPSNLTIAHVSDDAHQKFAGQCIKNIIKMAPNIDCERVVFHGFYHITELGNAVELASLHDKAFSKCVESVKHLDRLCHEFGVKMCFENINVYVHLDRPYYLIFSASPYDLIEATEEINSDAFKLCFDVAHAQNFCTFIQQCREMQVLYGVRELSVKDFFRIISNKVDIIHLSDTKGSVAGPKGIEHLPLGKGEIDFEGLFKEIYKTNLSVPLVLETDEANVNNAVNMVAGREYLNEMLGGWLESEKC
jgi:sugar phosphate isomerase/epimerase